MNERELLAKRANLIAQARAMLDVCESEKRDFTAEEQNNYDAIFADVQKIDVKVDNLRKLGTADDSAFRTSEPEQIHKAIISIHKEGYYYSEFIPSEYLEKDRDSILLQLSYQEMEFLSLCCSEMSYKAIADCMSVSIHTVEGYKKSLFKKLHTNSRIGLVLFALNMGMAPVYKK